MGSSSEPLLTFSIILDRSAKAVILRALQAIVKYQVGTIGHGLTTIGRGQIQLILSRSFRLLKRINQHRQFCTNLYRYKY